MVVGDFFDKEYRQKLLQLFLIDFKLRYNQTFLGVFWSFLKPLSLIITLLLVFSFMPSSIDNFAVYLILGVIVWTYFQTTTTRLLKSLESNKDFIRKIPFKKQLLLQSTLISETLNFFMLVIISLVIMPFLGVYPVLSITLLIPVFSLILLIYGLGSLLAIAYVYFKDIEYITELAFTLGFFLTPIFYQVSMIPSQYLVLYMFNPLTRVIESIRSSLFEGTLNGFMFELVTLLLSLSFFIVGVMIFYKYQEKLVDEL